MSNRGDESGPRDRGLAILETEVGVMTSALKRSSVWSRNDTATSAHPTLLQPFIKLRAVLAERTDISSLDDLDPVLFLTPFLDVIRSEVVTGPVTGLALDAMHKFLSYELLHVGMLDVAHAVESLADAVTHARFVGVDPSADEVVLMKILSVLITLMLTPVGLLLTNESVCEIMQSTFRICFETRLSDLLRKTAELALTDMIQLLFTRLPTFSEENLPLLKKLKMRNNGMANDGKSGRRHKGTSGKSGNYESRKKNAAAKHQQQQGLAETARKEPPPASLPVSEATTQANSDCETSLVLSPSSADLPGFDVDADVLARSPMGSVVDLTACIQSDNEDGEKQIQSDAEISMKINDPQLNPAGDSLPGVEPCEAGTVNCSTPKKTNQEDQDVDILLTSPGGTEAVMKEDVVADQPVETGPVEDEKPTTEATEIEKQAEDNGDEKTNGEQQSEENPVEEKESADKNDSGEFVNSQGVTFKPTAETVDESGSLIPYGLPCLRELFRFLVSIINPHEMAPSVAGSAASSSGPGAAFQNDSMIQIALALLATALETGAEHLDKYESLLELVKDDLSKNLVALLSPDRRLTTFSSALWISYLVFATQRKHLKYQMEIYLNKLMEIVSSESSSSYEHKEMVLELLVRFYKIPGFISELYLNFDCDLYTNNIFEDLTKMLSKNAFPLTGLYSTHFLSLEALLTVNEAIERQCHKRVQGISNNNSRKTTMAMAGTQNSKADKKRQVVEEEKTFPGLKGSGHLAGKSAVVANENAHQDDDENPQFSSPPETMTHEELMALKYKKKLITTATEQFNAKPAKGVAYLQEVGLIGTPLDITEIANFLRANPHLDKKQLGDYLSNRKNLNILGAFVQSFDFAGLRIDESLRLFLESFRLPGEAPLITLILEHFADHWHRSSGGHAYVANADAAFTLSYAVIMLNVDQHNKNHTKTNDPMTLDQFRRNVRGTNDGADHDQEMLAEIYHTIRNEEIVMPAEHTGLVKENYLWKCALKRGQEGNNASGRPVMLMTSEHTVMFDHDLFALVWGPTLAALCYVFDKSRPGTDDLMIEKCLSGFSRVASVAAHYRMSDVIDNMIVSLAKFTGLQNVVETAQTFVPHFGANAKAKLATKTVFKMAHKHGDILREGWRNIIEILLQLFRCDLLPKSLMEAEDYVESAGRVKLLRENTLSAPSVKVESGFLNSFVSFISMSSETAAANNRPRTAEEEESAKSAFKLVQDCHVENLVTESKFLLVDSLKHLVEHLISGSSIDFGPSTIEPPPKSGGRSSRSGAVSPVSGSGETGDDGKPAYDEQATIFFLELLLRITVQNRDRVSDIWTPVSDHLARMIMAASSSGQSCQTSNDQKSFLLERSVTALLRLAVRLGRKEDLASTVVQSLKTLLGLKANSIFQVARQVSFGMYEMLRNNAANIHETSDWDVVFAVIEIVGAGASPDDQDLTRKPKIAVSLEDDSGHCASSENESQAASSRPETPSLATRERSNSVGSSSGGWIVLNNNNPADEKAAAQNVKEEPTGPKMNLIAFNPASIVHPRSIVMHDSLAFLKSCESMAFLIRDVAHITPLNFSRCVQALRTFVEASFVERPDEATLQLVRQQDNNAKSHKDEKLIRSSVKRTPAFKPQSAMRRVRSAPSHQRKTAPSSGGGTASSANSDYDADESDNEDLSSEYHHVALQLLDLMHTLHTRAAQIHNDWAEEGESQDEQRASKNLWSIAWCPLLQGTARLCCDKRSHIRTSSLTTLQRALLFQDLQTYLTSREWESSFTRVLFPMLSHLLVQSQPGEKTAMEETRTRASTLLGKVFLQHLAPLAALPSFTPLWLTVLDFMERFMKAATSDLLSDAVPESLKNMLLVMDTAGVFESVERHQSLWELTWDKLEQFLPSLMQDLFGERQSKYLKNEIAETAPGPAPAPGQPDLVEKSNVQNVEKASEEQIQVLDNIPESQSEPPASPEKVKKHFDAQDNIVDDVQNVESQIAEPQTVKNEMTIDVPTINNSVIENPPISPLEPPAVPSSFFVPKVDHPVPILMSKDVGPRLPFRTTVIPAPIPTIVSLPSRPTIAPMPPPPPGILEAKTFQNFQPIHAALPTHGTSGVPLANPRPVLASYFGGSPSGAATTNILTTSFTPTLVNPSNPVVLIGGAHPPNPTQSMKPFDN